MGAEYSGCEIVELGIQIEKNGKAFYTRLAALTDNAEADAIFKQLAEAEDEHIAVFKEIFSGACAYNPSGAYPEEYFSYMNTLASQYIFTQENKGEELAKSVKSCSEGVKLGIRMEKDAILFYSEMRELVSDKDKPLIDKLIREERTHLGMLSELEGVCEK